MSKVCRIVESVNLNQRKFDELEEQAKLLGKIRKEVWQRFGSINGVGVHHRDIRKKWVNSRDFKPLPAKAWKETLRDTLDDISLYEAACKSHVKKYIVKRTNNSKERKRLFLKLKGSQWVNDSFLSRKMRKYKKHGKTDVANQIVLESGVYGQFSGIDGKTWLKVPTFVRGRPICIPLNSNVKLKGSLRLILKNKTVYVHYAIKQKKFADCGNGIIGVDKGYSEAFAGSDGEFFGTKMGKVLSCETERRNLRGIARNKLHQIAKKKKHKRSNLLKYNLGLRKINRINEKKKILVRDIAFESVHRIVDKASEVRAKDLTSSFASREKWKRYNRLMSAWAKGSLAEALESVTKSRGATLCLVNPAYTSQIDSNTKAFGGQKSPR